jgi:hypothetical protein
MPAAIVAAAITTAIEIGSQVVLGELLLSKVTLSLVAKTFAKHLIINALLGAVNKSREPNLNAEAQQRKQSIRSSVSPRRFVYGRARVSGTLVYAGSTGPTNEYLHLVMPIHHGEMDAIESVYLNDMLSTDSRFTGFLRVNSSLGTAGQVADADLVSESADWTTDHRLRGTGYLYLRMKYDATAFPNGIPNPSAVIRGRKVYDPRTGLTAWSNNPALCVLDYLIGTVPKATGTEPIGIGADLSTEIDLDTFVAAANICDEQVTLKEGGTHARYTCDGVVQMDASPAAVMEQLLTCCAGTLIYSGGQYRLFVGAANPATRTITADMLRGPVRYRPLGSRRDSSNGVRGTYVDPLNAYEAGDFPPQISSTYVTEDGGEERWMDLALPYTQDGVRAQRLAKQFLERARRSGEMELPCNFSALGIAVWDCVTVDIDGIGVAASSKWRVKNWTFAEGGGIDLSLQEESDAAYTWSTADEVTPAAIPRPTMVRAYEVEPPTDVLVSSDSYITPEGSAVGGLFVEWTAAADAFVTGYEIQYSATGDEDWQAGAGVGLVTSAQLPFLAIGSAYDVRVRSLRSGGAQSPWVTVTNTTVSGDASAPAAPSGVAATAESAAIKLDWVNPTDDDFRLARLYRHTSNDSGAASAIADVYGLPGQPGTYTDAVTSGQTRYYWIKARDMSGNLSVFSSGVNATAT